MHGAILTADEMRAAEAAADVSLSELMARAGAALAEAIWRYGGERPTLILCGPGNNGGDGYVAARLLKARGLDVRVAALREPRAELAIAARTKWDGPVEALDAAAPAPILVDALFGTGLARPLEPEVTAALARLKAGARFLIAVDLPSGVGTDDGAALGDVAADMTLALGSLKPAHLLQPSASLCGYVRIADIGIVANSNARVIERPALTVPGPDSHKYKRGLVAVLGGAMPGAALLAAEAAMRVAGYIVLCGGAAGGPMSLVRRDWGSILEHDRVGALLVGPGLGRDAPARSRLAEALATIHPLVLDADAVSMLDGELVAALRQRSAPVILTPHAGEFARAFGSPKGSRIDQARAAAAHSLSTIILKGADTVIASPDGRALVSPGAPGWLASAGTGDVLAGLVAALLSSGMAPLSAAEAAVWVHGEAARRAGPALIADDLPSHIPAAFAMCL